ncbi:hypothetical protein Tco_1100613, partial [Tanacetum coccineum]
TLLTICEGGAEGSELSNGDENRHVDDALLDKHRKLGTGRVMASTTSSQGRQALALVTTNQKEVAAASSEAQEKQDWMRDYLKRLKVCIKWFQKSLEDLAMEKDNLRNMLDSSERNRVKAEAAMKKKEEELKRNYLYIGSKYFVFES